MMKIINSLEAISATLKNVIGISYKDRYNLILVIEKLDSIIEELKKGETHGNNTDTDK